MSVHITVKFPGDTEVFQKSLIDRADEFVKVSETGRSMGAIHHYFGVGQDFVLVIDEWESPAHFEAFFGRPEMQEFVASVGADTSVPPEITVVEAIDSPDRF